MDRARLSDVDGVLQLTDQASAAFEPKHVWIDDAGNILFSDDAWPERVAALHDHDIELFSNHASLEAMTVSRKAACFTGGAAWTCRFIRSRARSRATR